MNKFWAFTQEDGKNFLRINAPIAEADSWIDNAITPNVFREELEACNGDVVIQINSYGGDVFAAATIYADLKNYSRGKITTEIIVAASAASVIAMAGDTVTILPTGVLMIHDPLISISANEQELKTAIKTLQTIKQTIVNAYILKTNLPRTKIENMMTAETWLSPQSALDLHFVDEILYTNNTYQLTNAVVFNSADTNELIRQKLANIQRTAKPKVDASKLYKRLMATRPRSYFIENFDDEEVQTMKTTTNNPNNSKVSVYPKSEDYYEKFLDEVRRNFKFANESLREGSDAHGAFLVPSSMNDAILQRLEDENIMRKLSTVITTESTYRVNFVASAPSAAWIGEGQAIPQSTGTFGQITLDAYKLATSLTVSNELLQDALYDIADFLVEQFSQILGSAEEDALLNGTPNSDTACPTGILTTLDTLTDTHVLTTSTDCKVSADDVIGLVYSLRRPYRKNAVFIANDRAIEQIRKLKDGDGNYIWANSMISGEPANLFGYPVHTSTYFPVAESSGDTLLAFGDFSKFYICDRGVRTFKPLRELYALNDLVCFMMIERLDSALVDKDAVHVLKVR